MASRLHPRGRARLRRQGNRHLSGEEASCPPLAPQGASSGMQVVSHLGLCSVWRRPPGGGRPSGRASRPPSRRKAPRPQGRAGHIAACAGRTRLTARMEGGTPSPRSVPGRQVDAVAGCKRPCATSGRFKARHCLVILPFAPLPSLRQCLALGLCSAWRRPPGGGRPSGRASRPPSRRKAPRPQGRAGHIAACAGRTRLTARMEDGTPFLPPSLWRVVPAGKSTQSPVANGHAPRQANSK